MSHRGGEDLCPGETNNKKPLCVVWGGAGSPGPGVEARSKQMNFSKLPLMTLTAETQDLDLSLLREIGASIMQRCSLCCRGREGGRTPASICLRPALEMLQVIKSGGCKKSITPLSLPQAPTCPGGDREEVWGPSQVTWAQSPHL